MSWMFEEAEIILRQDGCATVRIPDVNAIAFENDTVVGFVIEYESAASLLSNWERDEANLLERFTSALRSSGQKAWSVYTILLSGEQQTDRDASFSIEAIEENLRHTRKIPRLNIRTKNDIKAALAPVLAISLQHLSSSERFEERLATRLNQEIGQHATTAFLNNADDEFVARALAEDAP